MSRDQFEILDPTTFPGWDERILCARNYSFFHSSAWTRVLCESYGYRPSFLALSRGGEFSLVIPMLEVESFLTGKRGVSLPFSDCCEPIRFQRSTGFLKLVGVARQRAEKSGWKHLDFRGGGDFPFRVPVHSRYVCHRLELAEEKELLSGLHENTVRNLKRARKSGVSTGVFNSIEAMRQYYGLHCITRKRQGAPPQPFTFFQKIYEHICSKGKGRIILAHLDGKAVAGGIFFHFGRKAMYKYGASDRSLGGPGANAAIMWEAIRLYASEGYSRFCFGRTDPENLGLRRFKLGFGCEESLLDYHRLMVSTNGFVAGGSKRRHHLSGLMRLMPICGLKAIGAAYRHFG